MPDITDEKRSLAHFKRNAADVIRQMRKSGRPVVLTVNGKAAVVVQDAEAYERLRVIAERVEMLEFLQAAKADADAGRTVPAREFLLSLGRKKKAV